MSTAKYIKNKIKRFLGEDEKYRKSDLNLMARIWYDDLIRVGYGTPESYSAVDFLNMLRDGKLTNWDSATRCRRELQQKFPELRDEKVYKGRKKKETVMREKRQYY